jgi:hypothetical protein
MRASEDETLITKTVLRDNQVVEFDAVPYEQWTCAVVTCSSLVFLFGFSVGLVCGILIG